MTITDLNQLSVLIEVCTKLIKMRVGDKNKLQVIKARAELCRIIPQLDLKYVEKLMNYYLEYHLRGICSAKGIIELEKQLQN